MTFPPQPWRVTRHQTRRRYSVVDATDHLVVNAWIDDPAIAALIAAAPDLLAACSAFVTAFVTATDAIDPALNELAYFMAAGAIDAATGDAATGETPS